MSPAAPWVSPVLLLALAGCSGPLLPEPAREPPCVAAPCRAAHEGEVPVLVPFPPLPAKVDVIAAPPDDMADPVWVDGQWAWRGRGWIWEPGKWLARPRAQYWAGPAIVRRADGQLVWFAGAFRPFAASNVPPARPAASGGPLDVGPGGAAVPPGSPAIGPSGRQGGKPVGNAGLPSSGASGDKASQSP